MTDQLEAVAKSSYIHTITIRVPADTEWKPVQAQHCLAGLFAFYEPLTLLIRAQSEQMLWQVEVPRHLVQSVEVIFYGFYPQAEIVSVSKREADIGLYVYEFDGAAPFMGALQHATDLKEADPLAGVLTALTNLGEGEEIVISLSLRTPTKNYAKTGQRQLYTSGQRWFHFLSPRMTAEMFWYRSMFEIGKQKKQAADLHRLSEAKLRMPLKETTFAVRIRAASQSRADRLAAEVEPTLAIFQRPGLNALVPTQRGAYSLVLSAPEVAALWHPPTRDCLISNIDWASDLSVPLPRELSSIRNGPVLGKSIYQGQEIDVRLPYTDRSTHLNIVGKTRVGKSTLLHNLIHQDIRAGHGVCVIDPHGDLVQAILETSIPPEREQDVVLFDLQERRKIIGLNLLDVPRGVPPEDAAAMALAVLKKFFAQEWRPGRMEDTLHAVLVSLMSIAGSVVQDIPRILGDPAFRQKVIEQVQDPVALEYWALEFDSASVAQQRELALPITTRIRKLYRTPTMRRILGQPSSLDIAGIMQSDKILLVNLRGKGASEEGVGNTLGALLISKIQMAAMSRAHGGGVRAPFYLYVDEVQNFVTTSLPVVLSEAAKYGLYLHIANQFLAQLSGDTLQAVLGNVGATMTFRCGPEDATMLASSLKPHFSAAHIENLSRFKMIVKMQHQGMTLPPFVVHNYPPVERPDDFAERAQRIKEASRARYGMPSKEIDELLMQRVRRRDGETVAADDEDEDWNFDG